ncbi:MAG: DUF47 family protein [Coriobacteriaceae bacterium]|nr:DUF47 family protein [Coriobacteriaceae bacterium]
MPRKEKFDYFQGFVEISAYGVQRAEALRDFFEDHRKIIEEGGSIDVDQVLECYERGHKIETESDEVAHEIVEHLSTEFITPIEREDIQELVGELDGIVDAVDEVLQHVYMYNVTNIRPEGLEMCDIVVRTTKAVNKTCEKFTYFKKSHSIKDCIIDVNSCEEEGDRCYIDAMHRVFATPESSLEAFAWGRVLTSMEKCCDTCEHAVEIMNMVLMKNL